MSNAFMLIPFDVTDANFVSSNVPEDDYAEWSAATTYSVGDRVIVIATHDTYESIADGNLNFDPTDPANVPSKWLVVGKTNRWRAFDKSLGQSTSNPDSIQFRVGSTGRMDAVALIDVQATDAKITVRSPTEEITFEETRELLDISGISDWLGFFTYTNVFDPEVVFEDIGAFAGFSVEVLLETIGGTASIAEFVAGRAEPLGVVLDGTRSGFTDYSRKEIDQFGNISIVKRPTARRAEWEIIFPTQSNRRIQRALENARGDFAFFYPGADMVNFYISVYGVADDFFPALSSDGFTVATLSLTGAT